MAFVWVGEQMNLKSEILLNFYGGTYYVWSRYVFKRVNYTYNFKVMWPWETFSHVQFDFFYHDLEMSS